MDQETTKEENLMETLGKVDHSVCIWGVRGWYYIGKEENSGHILH